jgi:hypothetical protein
LTAFEKWFHRNFAESPDKGARYLIQIVANGPGDSVVWDYLELAGSEAGINRATFLEAAHIIIRKAEVPHE